jgi:hypothetical protein
MSFATRDDDAVQGHWLLARLGKRVLRPGGGKEVGVALCSNSFHCCESALDGGSGDVEQFGEVGEGARRRPEVRDWVWPGAGGVAVQPGIAAAVSTAGDNE